MNNVSKPRAGQQGMSQVSLLLFCSIALVFFFGFLRLPLAEEIKEEAPKKAISSRASLEMPDNYQGQKYVTILENIWRQSIARAKSIAERIKDNLIFVREINIEGNYHVSSADILSCLGIQQPCSILSSTIYSIPEKLLKHPWIKDANVSWQLLPASLTIKVEEREPWVIAEYENHSWLLSDSGTLMQTLESIKDPELISETVELPRLDGLEPRDGPESVMRSPDGRLKLAVKQMLYVQGTGKLPYEVDRYSLMDDGALRLTPRDESMPETIIAVNTYEEADELLSRLSLVLQDLSSRGEKVKLIDLRFRNQAIVK